MYARVGHDPLESAGVLFALVALGAADALLVVLSRRLAGRPLLRGAPDHLAHRLRRLGITAQGAVVLLGLLASCGVLAGVLVHMGRAECAGAAVGGGGGDRDRAGAAPGARARPPAPLPHRGPPAGESDIHAGRDVLACKERIRVEPV